VSSFSGEQYTVLVGGIPIKTVKIFTPFQSSWALRLRNMQRVATMITAIQIDIKGVGGKFVPLIPFDTTTIDPWIGREPDNLRRIVAQLLDRSLVNKNLEPGDIVRGWMLFDYLKEISSDIRPIFKVIIIDINGAAYSEPLEQIKSDDDWGGLQPIVFTFGEQANFSGRTIIHFRDIN
jgi:hypothetical protein